jgi:hypothetical protein
VKRKITWLSLSFLILAGMLLASCSTANTTTQAPPITTSEGPAVLTVTNGSVIKTYSMTDLQDANLVTGYGGEKEQDGTIIGPYPYQGVTLTDLLNAVGGITEGQSVKITASDGSYQTLSYDQRINGDFNIYDSAGGLLTRPTKPTISIIFSEYGNPLDNSTGPIELGTISTFNYITDASMWVKMVTTINVIPTK